MENAVVTREAREIEPITEKKLTEWLDAAGMTTKLLENEKSMFINVAREFHLNPFKREIFITAFGDGDNRKLSIITGYDVYIKRAERTGLLDGWEIKTEGNLTDKSLKAIVIIYRKDWKHPFVHEVYYSECVQYNKAGYPTSIWAKQPKFMTKKVAIGQAFRLCFPDDLGGMPYEEAEMPESEEKYANEPIDTETPENKIAPKEDVNDEAIELKELLDSGKMGTLSKAAMTALQNNDINTIRGLLKSYKTKTQTTSSKPERSLKDEFEKVAQGKSEINDNFEDDDPFEKSEVTEDLEQQEIF